MSTVRVAAIQLESVLGDVDRNLAMCEALADEAGAAGAEWIVLPEFFSTGMGFGPALEDAALRPDGPATELLISLARRHGARVGGSFLCRDSDGEVRNAFVLATPEGVVGRHDKDIPTMWENAWYVGGDDDGVIAVDGLRVGAALCLELGRTATVSRLRGVDLVLAGSFTWRFPRYWPRVLGRDRLDRRLSDEWPQWASPFARLVGAPVAEATHCGEAAFRDPLAPLTYRCGIGNGAKIVASDGTVLARRDRLEGPGVVLAEVTVGSVEPLEQLPERHYIDPPGIFWDRPFHLYGALGRRHYRSRRKAGADSAG